MIEIVEQVILVFDLEKLSRSVSNKSNHNHLFDRLSVQGSYQSWKTWKVMEFDNLDSRPGKSWNFGPGPGKSWNFMLANVYAAELPTVLDCLTCMREKKLTYGNM